MTDVVKEVPGRYLNGLRGLAARAIHRRNAITSRPAAPTPAEKDVMMHASRLLECWKERVHALKKEVRALNLARRDPRVPRRAKILAALLVAYALSPIDLIPDFIPVLGYLDDLIILPLGILLVLRMIPAEVLRDCRKQAETAQLKTG